MMLDTDTTIGGRVYRFRAPTLYDTPMMRRRLTRAGVRYPSADEYRVCAAAGIRRLGEEVGDVGEGERQAALIHRWYDLLPPIDEDDIDEPDFEARAEMHKQAEAERSADLQALLPDVQAIEANLDRHYPPWRELRADAAYWEEISRIDSVRVLLMSIDGRILARDEDGLLREDEYQAIEEKHRFALGRHALALLAPSEKTRKN